MAVSLSKLHPCNMKRIFLILFLLCGFKVEAQTQIVTGTFTVTNVATNGWTFSVNGHLRTITNYVTAANNQILTNLDIPGVTSNIFNAFISYPETSPFMLVTQTATNVIQFQTLASLYPTLVFATNWGAAGMATANWATWVYTTNTLTNANVVRLPTNAIGAIERTNDQNWLVQLLDDPGTTNSFSYSSPLWRQFLGTNFGAGVTNFVLNTSNNLYTNISWQYTNFTTNLNTTSSNALAAFDGVLSTNNTNFTLFSSNYLFDLFFPLLGAISPWQDGSQDVFLTNSYGVIRIQAVNSGGSIGGGTYFYASDGSTQWLINDGNVSTLIKDSGGAQRWESDDTRSGSGNTYIRSSTGLNLGNNGPNVGSGGAIGAGIAIGQNQGTLFASRPIVFQNVTLPAVAIGTVTNFAPPSVTSDSTYDSFTIPGDCLTNVGDTIVRYIGIKFTAATSFNIAIEFQGNNILQTGAFTSLNPGYLSIRCEVECRSGTFYANSSAVGSQLSTNNFAFVGTGSIATGGGNPTNFLINVVADGGSGNTLIYNDRTVLAPSGQWNALP
jgi:hypothetical protein